MLPKGSFTLDAVSCGNCGMRQKRRNIPHDTAPQRTASGVTEPLSKVNLHGGARHGFTYSTLDS